MQKTVTIIGGGFSGFIAATHLCKAGFKGKINIIEKGSSPGSGIAYGAFSNRFLLNVPAAAMSAFADDPNHLVNWLEHQGHADPKWNFIPRQTYGDYIRDNLQSVSNPNEIQLSIINETASDVTFQNGSFYTKFSSDKEEALSDYVILAMGNFPPKFPPPFKNDPANGLFENAWNKEVLENFNPSLPIVLIGSGLTAVDIIVELQGIGFKAPIISISRRGLLPQPHIIPLSPPGEAPSFNNTTLSDIARTLIQNARQAAKQNGNWRTAIDSVRSQTQQIWSKFSIKEQKRFLRHLRPFWDICRHRLAPELHHLIKTLEGTKQLNFIAGRIINYEINPLNKNIKISIIKRYTNQPEIIECARIINCTGPASNLKHVNDPLLQNLLAKSLITLDPHNLGIQTDDQGGIINNITPKNRFFAVGPLRKGTKWEITAVREIREELGNLSQLISNS